MRFAQGKLRKGSPLLSRDVLCAHHDKITEQQIHVHYANKKERVMILPANVR
jgi:hypothetical protein